MKTYVDTSVVVSLYITDSNSLRADAWRLANPAALYLTDFHLTELRNAVNLAVFQQRLREEEAKATWSLIEADFSNELLVLKTVDWQRVFQEAGRLIERHTPSIGCRTLDVMHVAAALVSKAANFCSFDERQSKLAALAGLQVEP